MHLKQTILALLSPEALKEVCGHLDVDLNCRTKAAMVRHLLPQESISAERLLPLLTESELQAVCAACGVPATGRKATLVKRLVKQARGPTFVALDFETADYSPGQRLRPGFGAGGKPPDCPAHLSPHPAAPPEICLYLSARHHLGRRGRASRLLPNYGRA